MTCPGDDGRIRPGTRRMLQTPSMKVLHLPSNLASQLSITVGALRDIGVDARGLACGNLILCDAANVEVYDVPSLKRRPLRSALAMLRRLPAARRAMRWADVIHWHSDWSPVPWDLEPRYAARLGKPRIVEFWGTDIRIPEIACADNPYMAQAYREYPRLFRHGRRSGRRTQERFARYGFACLIPGRDLQSYVQRDVFPSHYSTVTRLALGQFEPRYPDPNNGLPLVVHAPSQVAVKGTSAVLAAIEKLRATHRFEFRLIQSMPHRAALDLVRQCDVFLDQFVGGDHGAAALEAMALGKPTLCYIKPSLEATFPPDCPLVNASQENLAQVLGGLLEDGPRRHRLGRQGPAYVAKYHDAHKIARDLVTIYEELLAAPFDKAATVGRAGG